MNPTASAWASPTSAAPHWYSSLAGDLEQVEEVLRDALRSRDAKVAEIIDHIRHYRGKRLRPALLLLTAKATGAITPAHHTLGAVVEMIHTATLVHDDVLDHATMRRHVATVNARWGTQASVLLGDHLFTRAFHLASTVGDANACLMIGEATNRVCEGELRQDLESGNPDLTEEEYYRIIEGKTAELIACCCQLGAHYAGAEPRVVEGLRRYGLALGTAFQMADDLLDLMGEEKATGKSLGTDVQLQKLTLPMIHLFRETTGARREHVRALFGKPSPETRPELIRLLSEHGSLAYAHQQAVERARRAQAELAVLAPSPERASLSALAEQVIRRDR